MIHIYFVCGNISPTLTSLMKNANVPATQHQSLCLAPTFWLFRFMAFFPFLHHERPSVFPERIYVQEHSWTNTYIVRVCIQPFFTALLSCHSKMISKSNKSLTVQQLRDKPEGGEGEGEEDGRSGHGGIVRPHESSLQKQKQLWMCTHSEERLAGNTHTPQHTTRVRTAPAVNSFGCSLAARGTALDTYHVRQVLLLGFLFFRT